MIIWLTLDSIWTYLIDGVYGCRLWVSEPVLHPELGWTSPEQQRSCISPGKKFFRYRQQDLIDVDMSIMWHFVPEMDMREDRWARFDLIREFRRRQRSSEEARMSGIPDEFRCTWKMPLHISPQEWFQIALDTAGEGGVWEAAHAQKTFDLPF